MVKEILARHNINTVNDLDMAMSHCGSAFEELYEYYLLSGEMPVGVAKARTGDPQSWMYDRLEELLES